MAGGGGGGGRPRSPEISAIRNPACPRMTTGRPKLGACSPGPLSETHPPTPQRSLPHAPTRTPARPQPQAYAHTHTHRLPPALPRGGMGVLQLYSLLTLQCLVDALGGVTSASILTGNRKT